MGLCETSNFSILTFINASDLKFCMYSYSSCVYRMMRLVQMEKLAKRCHSLELYYKRVLGSATGGQVLEISLICELFTWIITDFGYLAGEKILLDSLENPTKNS